MDSDQAIKFNDIWIEKYRPTTLKDIILDEDIKTYFYNSKKTQSIPHILLVGPPGTGKSSLSKIIYKDILNSQHIYINASDENGIDTIRTKVNNFAQTQSIYNTVKIIILDECDGLSLDAQKCLRNSIEEYSNITRFILTANYLHKIIPAIQSRCQLFNLLPPKKECLKRILTIIKNEKLSIDKKSISEIFSTSYPDMRKCIGNLHLYKLSNGKYKFKDNLNKLINDILILIKSKNNYELRKHIIHNEHLFNNDYNVLFKYLFDSFYENKMNLSEDKIREILLIISEYYYRNNIIIDKEINFYSCLLDLSLHIH